MKRHLVRRSARCRDHDDRGDRQGQELQDDHDDSAGRSRCRTRWKPGSARSSSSTASRTKPTVEKLYDNLDFQRAVQAYLLGLAPVNQVANRKGMLEVGPANTTVPIFETMMNARSIFLTPNNNTPYTWFWLDLRNGPLVLEVPPKVLGLIDDMWYHFVTDVGMVGPDKGEGGKYLLLPPGYKGEVPKGTLSCGRRRSVSGCRGAPSWRTATRSRAWTG